MRKPLAIAAAFLLTAVSLVASGQTQTDPTRIFRSAEVVTASGVPIPFNSVANGIVELHLSISATGNVDEVVVARPLASVTEQAVSAVKAWTFAPATMRGKPIASRLTVAVAFCPAYGYGLGDIPLPPVSPESAKDAGASSLIPTSPEIIAAKYPLDRAVQLMGGTVVIRVLIGVDGQPGLVRVIRGKAPLVDDARLAVKDWTFSPARLNGKEVISGIVVALRFRTPVSTP
jgi:outer membrane biosynthesis protein TonB